MSNAAKMSRDNRDSWRETVEITSDPALMAEIRRGVRQIERGQTASYAEVFRQKPRGKKRSKGRRAGA
jgi:PHD/YefM family antitoxin component YafN of YafNO toxin-antitoxin module